MTKQSELFQEVLKIECSKNGCFWVRETMMLTIEIDAKKNKIARFETNTKEVTSYFST
jgi:hypothetical protein